MNDAAEANEPLTVSVTLRANIRKSFGPPEQRSEGNWFDLDKPLSLQFKAPLQSNFSTIAGNCRNTLNGTSSILFPHFDHDTNTQNVTLSFSSVANMNAFLGALDHEAVSISQDSKLTALKLQAKKICAAADQVKALEAGKQGPAK